MISETVRRHFSAPKVSLIGESYLGMMVVLYATQHPEHVERIVQIDPVPRKFDAKYPAEYTAQDADRIPDPAQMKNLERLRAEGFEENHPREYCEKDWAVTRTMLVGNPANAEKAGPGYCEFPNEWPMNLDKHFEASIGSIERLHIRDQDLARVTMPVLTIHGTRDRNAPYGSGREWAAALPDARLVTAEGAAHFPWLDNPALVFSSITEFLSGRWPAAAQKLVSQDESVVQGSPAFKAQEALREVDVQPTVALPSELARVLTDYERQWTHGDSVALAGLFTEDGIVLSPGNQMVRGRAAIERFYRGPGSPLSLRAVAFAADGRVGYIIGGFSRHATAPEIGKFTLTLRRDANGRWLIQSDMDNGNSR